MTAFSRGDVVARDGRRAVVWSIEGDRLTILPLASDQRPFAGDVAIEADADRLTLRARRFAVVRTARAHGVPAARHARVGRVSAALLAALIPAAGRAQQSAAWCTVWNAEIRHRRRAFEERTALR